MSGSVRASGAPASSSARARAASNAISAVAAAVGPLQPESIIVAAEPDQVLARHVDAAARVVLGDVLQVLDDLQSGADPVRERDPLRRRGAEHVQHQLADRCGRQLAVAEQLRRSVS